MILAFTLSMPSVNSWNGRWSGEGRIYAIVRNFPGKKGEAKAQRILDGGYYHYSFGDGWAAGIDVKAVDKDEARRIRQKSVGFAGYDWMVSSICDYGKIMRDDQIRDMLQKQKAEAATAHAGAGI